MVYPVLAIGYYLPSHIWFLQEQTVFLGWLNVSMSTDKFFTAQSQEKAFVYLCHIFFAFGENH